MRCGSGELFGKVGDYFKFVRDNLTMECNQLIAVLFLCHRAQPVKIRYKFSSLREVDRSFPRGSTMRKLSVAIRYFHLLTYLP